MRKNITQREAPARIRAREPFHASALTATPGASGIGDLPPDLATLYVREDVGPDLFATGQAAHVGEEERAVPPRHYPARGW